MLASSSPQPAEFGRATRVATRRSALVVMPVSPERLHRGCCARCDHSQCQGKRVGVYKSRRTSAAEFKVGGGPGGIGSAPMRVFKPALRQLSKYLRWTLHACLGASEDVGCVEAFTCEASRKPVPLWRRLAIEVRFGTTSLGCCCVVGDADDEDADGCASHRLCAGASHA